MGIPLTIETANLGMADSLILMVMALVVFGPRRLPQIGRQIGKLMYEFRKASNDFKFQMEEELRSAEEADRRKKEEERLRTLPAGTVEVEQRKLSAPEAVAHLVPSEPVETVLPAVYPPNLDDGVIPVAATSAPMPVTEETTPRILPPSTGEQVFAAPPHSLTALARAAQEQNSAEPADAAEPTAQESEPEQAAHG
ncbi:MAG: twin-arginine translocase TatA/TatE family subunit [Terracidiphilus sp.]|jgi:sec-independent protein translocase protein TatB